MQVLRRMLKSKIHRAKVTEANLKYQGSITIDSYLLEQADILPHEEVQVVNNNNGERFLTYVIAGPKHSGVICLNGAAARLVQIDDEVIIISYALLPEAEVRAYKPKILFVNDKNKIEEVGEEKAFTS